MDRHTSMMMGLYLIVIATGVIIVQSHPFIGIFQICFGAFFFALRLMLVLRRKV